MGSECKLSGEELRGVGLSRGLWDCFVPISISSRGVLCPRAGFGAFRQPTPLFAYTGGWEKGEMTGKGTLIRCFDFQPSSFFFFFFCSFFLSSFFPFPVFFCAVTIL